VQHAHFAGFKYYQTTRACVFACPRGVLFLQAVWLSGVNHEIRFHAVALQPAVKLLALGR